MKINILAIGKAHEEYIMSGVDEFTRRISNYFSIEWVLMPVTKNTTVLNEHNLKNKEAEMILQWLKKDDYLIVLDEKGNQFSSEKLAYFIQQRGNESVKRLVFLIGGAYGVNDKILNRADYLWSLSHLTFPHQLVRLILAEQIYRACTIIRNEKYHHW